MKDFVLYCKSYSQDFLRLKRLLDSVKKFNVDQIPFFISTPQAEKDLLVSLIGVDGYSWVADEDIVRANPLADFSKYQSMAGGLSQQIIKSEFWRLGLTENYLCLDSDSFFIREFRKSDFVSDQNIPYTVLHQNKELFQLAADRGYSKVKHNLRLEAERVQNLFERQGPLFYCAPSPFNWSAKVWKTLDAEYLQSRKISIWDLITPDLPESLIYGEALLKYQAIPLIAIEPLFRVYHYDWQYYLMKRLGETPEKIAQNYLGLIYQSAWEAELDFKQSSKSLPSQMLKRAKRLAKHIHAYF